MLVLFAFSPEGEHGLLHFADGGFEHYARHHVVALLFELDCSEVG